MTIRGDDATIPIAHLRAAGLGEQVETLSTAVAEYLDADKTLDRVDSNVAVISDPFGGRDALLDYAADLLADLVGGLILVVVEFYIDVDADTGRARDIVEDALATSQYVLVSEVHPYTVRVADNQYYRTLTGKAYVNDLRNEQAFKSDVTERVLDAFAAEGIESPKVPAGGSHDE